MRMETNKKGLKFHNIILNIQNLNNYDSIYNEKVDNKYSWNKLDRKKGNQDK